jgi:polysaccharide export outer membrane protein
MRRVIRVFAVISVSLAILGCGAKVAVDKSTDEAAALAGAIDRQYRIGVDDRLQINVWRNPELSVTVPVRPDGMISMPLAGDVKAGGRTPEEVAASIREKLGTYIREPSVTVIVIELRSHEFLSRVRVTGAVRTPRSLPFRQGMTVLDAVLEAGGTNDFASPNRTKLFRKAAGQTIVHDIELGDILNKGKLSTNYELKPGDVITIPERLF